MEDARLVDCRAPYILPRPKPEYARVASVVPREGSTWHYPQQLALRAAQAT